MNPFFESFDHDFVSCHSRKKGKKGLLTTTHGVGWYCGNMFAFESDSVPNPVPVPTTAVTFSWFS